VTVPTERTDGLIAALRGHDGLVSLGVQRAGSLYPPGDVITATVTTSSLAAIMRLLDEHGVGEDRGVSLTTSQPVSVVSATHAAALSRDTSEATWEEMEASISHESNPGPNTYALMAISGAVAAVGLATNALHLVIGAMLVAPGFEPILRIGLGLASQGIRWQRGIVDSAKIYGALVAGAAATAVVYRLVGKSPLGEGASYLPPDVLISYWTTISWTAVLVSAAASLAGAVVVAANRSVLTAGVMVMLALIPGATIAPMAIVAGSPSVAWQGALRWLIDVALVVVLGGAVFAWKQRRVHGRRSKA
jgi:hypothetical protein